MKGKKDCLDNTETIFLKQMFKITLLSSFRIQYWFSSLLELVRWGLKHFAQWKIIVLTEKKKKKLPLIRWLCGQESVYNVRDEGLIPGSGRFPQRRKWQAIPVFLPRKALGQRGPGVLQSTGSQKCCTWYIN